jgi:polysaccharide pyruvyl transferase WcaK-like protein
MSFQEYIGFQNKIIIVGGGGLLRKYFEVPLTNILKIAKKNKLVFWGVGLDNYVKEKSYTTLDKTNIFKIATRDFYDNTSYDYVPCPSCLSALFDLYINHQKISSAYGLYLHRDYSEQIENDLSNVPSLYNHEAKTLNESLKFLSSRNIIITNSFHGLYWSTLLGKKVIVVPWIDKEGDIGFSHKFKSFKYKPYFLEDWSKYQSVSNLNNYVNALKECRDINYEMHAYVQQLWHVKHDT